MKSFVMTGLVLAAAASSVDAATLAYRETFSSADNNASIGNVGWTAYSTGTALTPPNDNSCNLSSLTGRAFADLTGNQNVNAGGDAALTTGFLFFGTAAGAPLLNYTTEYQGLTTSSADSFSWYMGNSATTDSVRVAVQVAGNWYASNTAFSTAGTTNGAGFAANAEPMSFNFTTAGSAWRQMTVNPGVELSMLGTTLAGSLPADTTITGFGLYASDSRAANIRIDTFSAMSVPEPVSMAVLGLSGLLLIRRRVA